MSEEAKKIKPGNSNTNIYDIIKKCSLNEENEYKLMKYIQSKKRLKELEKKIYKQCYRYA